MQLKKEINNRYKFLQSKFLVITLSMILLLSTLTLNPEQNVFAQQQQQE